MHDVPRRGVRFPESQQAVRDKCRHPTGTFLEFKLEEIEQSIAERFEQQVREHPHRLAIETGGKYFSYRALNDAANCVAWTILAAQKARDKPIAMLLEQGFQIIPAILGVLKAGHFYVPLDPVYPLPRLTYMLEDSQAVLLITNNQYLHLANELSPSRIHILNIDQLPTDVSLENPNFPIDSKSLACLIYTSGSTGQPKGVMHTHLTMLHMTMVTTNALRICTEDRFALFHSPSFIAATRLILLAVLNGAALFFFNLKEEGLTHFATWLANNDITLYYSVPVVFHHLTSTLQDVEMFPSMRLIWLVGESIDQRDVDLYREYFHSDCILIHGFGGTEMGTALFYFVDRKTQFTGNKVPLGYAVEEVEVMLLDENGEEVDNGGTGEIAVKSRYLALGYWHQPELTQAVFRPYPSGGDARVYHTGDLGRRLPDGCLEHLGRRDWQVKIRGYRIDVGEIEMALLGVPTVAEAIVMPWEFQGRDMRLVAYVVPAKDSAGVVSDLRRFLQAKMPEYMVPSVFVRLDALPLAPNGKVDRQALPTPNQSRPELVSIPVAPRTPVETVLAGIWAEVLGVEQVGVHDNFFELGGHSLLATQVMARLYGAFRVGLPLRSFLEAPTVAALAEQISMICWALPDPQAPRDLTGSHEEGRL